SCGEDRNDTEWKSDPLQWDLDPPCSEAEWKYLQELHGAPEYMEGKKCTYMNKICRGCCNARLEIMARVVTRIRSKGGLEELQPTARMKKEYEEAHGNDLVAKRPARIDGLQSAASAALNGQVCRLLSRDAETGRWTVELVTGEQKSLKEGNLSASKDTDAEWDLQHIKYLRQSSGPAAETAANARPLGSKTTWPKVKGIHPGAVVRLQGLSAAKELNGRKGRCINFDAEVGRWKVDLGDEHKSLKVENLVPAPTEKPPTRESAVAESAGSAAEQSRKAGLSAKEHFAEDYGS
ncbi:unnamed protein product, partial [Polarella glacialis]